MKKCLEEKEFLTRDKELKNRTEKERKRSDIENGEKSWIVKDSHNGKNMKTCLKNMNNVTMFLKLHNNQMVFQIIMHQDQQYI